MFFSSDMFTQPIAKSRGLTIQVSIYFCIMCKKRKLFGAISYEPEGGKCQHAHPFLLASATLRYCAIYKLPVFPPLPKDIRLCCGGKGCWFANWPSYMEGKERWQKEAAAPDEQVAG